MRRQSGASRRSAPKDGCTRRRAIASTRPRWRRSAGSSAREAALKVAAGRLALGLSEPAVVSDADMAAFEAALGLPAIHRAQAGLIADMDFIADMLYGRAAKHERSTCRGCSLADQRAGACRSSARRPAMPSLRSAIMENTAYRAIAIVGVGAILPDAPNVCFLEERKERPLQHQRRHARPLGPGFLLRRRSDRARQDILEDRRMGARVRVGADEVAPADSTSRRRCYGRGAAMGRRLHAGSAGRLRLSQAAARP